MAFGRASDTTKTLQDPVTQCVMWKKNVANEEKGTRAWWLKWDWYLEEYRKLQRYTKPAGSPSPEEEDHLERFRLEDREGRQIRAIGDLPKTTNHMYGWVAGKPELQLDRYGPDVDKGLPLPEKYHLFKGLLE